MQKLIEFNENQDKPLYRPSHLQELRHRSEYFEVPDLDTKVQRHDNPHYWQQRDILQIKNFQYCDAMMHVLKDSINLKYSELLTKVISRCNLI